MEHFFSPDSSKDLRSGADQCQIIGGDADVDHTQIFGGDTVKLLGDIPPFPRVSAPLQVTNHATSIINVKQCMKKYWNSTTTN